MLCEEPFLVVGWRKTSTVSATAEQTLIIAHAETYFAVVADGRYIDTIYILYTIYITIHIVHILYWLYHYIYIMCFLGSILWICREFEPSPHSLTGCLHRNSEVESGLSYGRADAQQRLLGSSAKVAISYAVEIQGQQRGQGFQIQHVVWWQFREVIPSINSKWCCNPPFFKASFQGIRWLFLNFFLSFL